MIKDLVSVFFTILFMAIITAPLIMTIIDDSIDVSVFYDLSEEEDEKKLEILFNGDNETVSFLESRSIEYLGFNFKKYLKPDLNLIAPPPKI